MFVLLELKDKEDVQLTTRRQFGNHRHFDRTVDSYYILPTCWRPSSGRPGWDRGARARSTARVVWAHWYKNLRSHLSWNSLSVYPCMNWNALSAIWCDRWADGTVCAAELPIANTVWGSYTFRFELHAGRLCFSLCVDSMQEKGSISKGSCRTWRSIW